MSELTTNQLNQDPGTTTPLPEQPVGSNPEATTEDTTTTTVDQQPTTDTTVYEGPAEVSSRTIVRNEDGSITDSAFPETTSTTEVTPDSPVVAPANTEVTNTATEPVSTPETTVSEPVTTEVQGDAIVAVKPNVNQEPEVQATDHLGGIALGAAAAVTATVAGAKRLFGRKS